MSRESAIAMLMGNGQAAQETPQVNQNAVSPEELGAVQAPQVAQTEGQINNTEATKAAETPPAKEEAPISQQYAVLARKEKALRAKVQAQEASFKAKEEALAAREAAIKAKDTDYQTNYIPKEKITQDTWNTLAELGITYDQVTEQALSQQTQDPRMMAVIKKLENEVKALKGEHENTRKSIDEQQAGAYKQALNQITTEAKQLVYTDPAYETIKATNSVSDIVDLIEQTFKADGILLSVEDAAKEVEEYLAEEYSKIAQISKIQQRLKANAEKNRAAAPQKQEEPKQQQQQLKTLTNAVSSSRKLSAKERAILAFKGELK